MSVNKFIGIGNLGRTAESRQVGQSLVIKFSIAMTERFKDQTGQQQERTEWADVEYWGSPGILPYLVTGQQVYVEGSLRTDKWQDQQSGQWRSATKVRARMVQLLGSPRQQVQQQNQQQNYAPQQGYRQQGQANYAQPQQQYAQQPAYQPQQARPRPAARPQAPQQQPQQAYSQPQPEPEQMFDGQGGQGEGGGDLPF